MSSHPAPTVALLPARLRLLASLAALLVLLMQAACGGGGPSGQVSTFARSFGGPGDDTAVDLATDANGRLSVAAIRVDPLVGGGSEDRPWLLGLDEAGNLRHETTPVAAAGVGSGVQFTIARESADDSVLHVGGVRSDAHGIDVILQRLRADGSVQWNLQLDSGAWAGNRAFDTRARPGADDRVVGVWGDDSRGWYVVARSEADLAPRSATGGAVVVNAQSLFVWFVEPGGTVRWQRRIAATQRDEDLIIGPALQAARLLETGTLVMAVQHLDGSRPDVSLLWLDAGNGLVESADDFGSAIDLAYVRGFWPIAGRGLSAEEYPGSAQQPKLLDTRDGGVLYVLHDFFLIGSDGMETRAWKLDGRGRVEWQRTMPSVGTGDPRRKAPHAQLAVTFPGGRPDAAVYWVGSSEQRPSQDHDVSLLWQLAADGQIIRRCEMGEDYPSLLATETVDGGQNLRVLAQDSAHGLRLREWVIPSSCGSALPGRTYTYGGLTYVGVGGQEQRTAYWIGERLVLARRSSFTNESMATSRFEETAVFGQRAIQTTTFLPGPRFSAAPIFDDYGALGAAADGRLSWTLRRNSGSPRASLISFGADGAATREVRMAQDAEPNSIVETATNAVFAPSGREYVGATPYWCDGAVRFVIRRPDGQILLARHPAPYRLGENLRPGHDGEVTALIRPCEGTGAPGVLSYRADDRAQVRYLSEAAAASDFARLDQTDAATLLLTSPGRLLPTGDTVAWFPAGTGAGWQVALPGTLGAAASSTVNLVDGVVAHDGGALLLLRLQAFSLPAGLADPAQSVGDVDLGLLKLDPQGRAQWLRVYGTGGNDEPQRLVRTPGGFGVLATSDGVDAVTPGSTDIWVLHTGPDGHIQGLATGEDLCPACLGTLSGQALATLLPLPVTALPPLSAPETLVFTVTPLEVESRAPISAALPGQNTARQCLGTATDIQELPLGVAPPPAACSDGLDNDGDGLIDAADPGCLNADDPTETDPPPPQRELRIEVVGDGRVFSAPGSGIDCREADAGTAACRSSYPDGDTARVVVEQDAGATFQGWSGDCPEGTTGTLDILMDRHRVCRAQFSRVVVLPPQRMTVSLQTDGGPVNGPVQGGTVAGNGVQCFGATGDCEQDHPQGTTAELLAVPTTGYVFDGWASPDPAQACAGADLSEQRIRVTMDQARACRALFRTVAPGPDLFLRVLADTDGVFRSTNALGGQSDGGRVTGTNPTAAPDIACTPTQAFCAREFAPGTPVTLTATPEPGYRFLRWFSPTDPASPCNPGTTATTLTLTMNQATTCRASFGTLPTNPGGPTNRLTVLFDIPFDRPHAVRVIDVDHHLVDCTAAPCIVDVPHHNLPIRLRLVDQYGNGVVTASCDDQTQPDIPGIARRLCAKDIHLRDQSLIVQWVLP